jgi:hypothetical protein
MSNSPSSRHDNIVPSATGKDVSLPPQEAPVSPVDPTPPGDPQEAPVAPVDPTPPGEPETPPVRKDLPLSDLGL